MLPLTTTVSVVAVSDLCSGRSEGARSAIYWAYEACIGRGEEDKMDEMEEGKQKFLDVVRGIDGAVQVVIPVSPSNSLFLISLTKGANRKFITVPEDDMMDLPHDTSIEAKVAKMLKDAIASL